MPTNLIQQITTKWLLIKNYVIAETSCLTQKWLNAQRLPRRGRVLNKNIISVETNKHSVILHSPEGKSAFFPFGRGIFRVYLNGMTAGESLYENHSWTIELAGKNAGSWIFTKTSKTAIFTHEQKARLQINTIDGSMEFYLGKDLVMADALPHQVQKGWLLVKKILKLSREVKVFGLGENTQPMNKAGQKIIMWNTDCLKYKTGSKPLYQSWPVVIFQFTEGPAFGMVFDNPSYAEFNFSTDGKNMHYAVRDNELNYFLLLGPTLPEVMQQLAQLTGKLPPLPKWALGYQQSRWSYKPSSRVREIAGEFRKRDISCDVIYLDIDYMDQFKCFTWGEGFQDFRKLSKDLHAQGFKIVTIMDPGLKKEPGYQPYETGLSRKLFVLNHKDHWLAKKVWAGVSHFSDFINPAAREWWGELISEFAKSGVDGIWCDMNEPSTFDCRRTLSPKARHLFKGLTLPHARVHNVYGFLMSRATYEGLKKNTRNPYVITRSTYLGGQKYATTWTGDNTSNWEHLRASIPMILNLGLSGQPVAGPDIGGYSGTPSPELYERWILQGALYPYSRSHTARDTPDQEPWSFGPRVQDSARKAIKLRYRLIPYLYSLLFAATVSGEPIMRPIFYGQPTGEALKPEYYETEFLLGPNLLVTPLMDQGLERTCYLPPGRWYSWWSTRELKGGQVYKTDLNKDTELPLFIRENSIIPTYPEAPPYISDQSLPQLELMIVTNSNTAGTVVEYFDGNSLLAYDVQVTTEKGFIVFEMDIKTEGNPPKEYHPPQIVHLLINQKVGRLKKGACKNYVLKTYPKNDSWTRITLINPVFPLKCILIST